MICAYCRNQSTGGCDFCRPQQNKPVYTSPMSNKHLIETLAIRDIRIAELEETLKNYLKNADARMVCEFSFPDCMYPINGDTINVLVAEKHNLQRKLKQVTEWAWELHQELSLRMDCGDGCNGCPVCNIPDAACDTAEEAPHD